jgi:amidohydrolase
MHACGHDGHTAMLLSAARMLYARRDEIPGTIVFCFQPAEEGRGGAKRMIEEGLLEDPHVDAAISIHLLSFEPTGIAVAVDGPTLAGSDRFSATIQGSGGHGAMPHKTVDALLIAAEVVTTLQTLVAREVDPLKSAVVTVGTLHAGTTAANIIADSATMSGTVRWYDDEVGDMLARRIPELIQGIASTMRGSADVQYRRGIGATVNDPAVAAIVREAASEVVGPENTWSGPRLSASDDICEILKLVPGTHFFVGCRDESAGKIYEHHHPRFDIDERALPLGVEIFTRAALLWLERNKA